MAPGSDFGSWGVGSLDTHTRWARQHYSVIGRLNKIPLCCWLCRTKTVVYFVYGRTAVYSRVHHDDVHLPSQPY